MDYHADPHQQYGRPQQYRQNQQYGQQQYRQAQQGYGHQQHQYGQQRQYGQQQPQHYQQQLRQPRQYAAGSMSSVPVLPPSTIDVSDPSQHQVYHANREQDEQRSHIRFGGPEAIVPKANVPTRYSEKITATSFSFRGPETFTHAEIRAEHANRRRPPGATFMPPSQLSRHGGVLTGAHDMHHSTKMAAPTDLSHVDHIRDQRCLTDDLPHLPEGLYLDVHGVVRRRSVEHPYQMGGSKVGTAMRWDDQHVPRRVDTACPPPGMGSAGSAREQATLSPHQAMHQDRALSLRLSLCLPPPSVPLRGDTPHASCRTAHPPHPCGPRRRCSSGPRPTPPPPPSTPSWTRSSSGTIWTSPRRPHSRPHAPTLTRTHAPTHPRTHAPTHTRTHAHTHTHMHMHTQTRTCTRTRKHAHVHPHLVPTAQPLSASEAAGRQADASSGDCSPRLQPRLQPATAAHDCSPGCSPRSPQPR